MSPAKGKLEDQAAAAALRVTKGKSDKSEKPSNYPLDADGKLSSASAATSLKHAQPQDLPAYPIVGLQNTDSSAGAAASLANAHPRTVEYWKPGNIPEANKAAHLAKDYKAEPLWQPDLGPAGSKAALQAHREGADVKIWRPSETDTGHSAAGQAMRKKGLSPQVQRGPTPDGESKALMAAKGALSGSRKRSDSTPTPANLYPDSDKSAANALKAATSANRPARASQSPASSSQPSINAGRIHNQAVTNLSREMYTSHPPVAPELEERKRQDTMHAAAVSMAKRMYDVQQKRMQEEAALRRSDGQYAASAVGDRPQSSLSSGTTEPPKYVNLEEAAKKLAAERLAKLHDEHAAYRTYYGTAKAPSKRMSMRGRRRASSEGEAGDSDEERSRQIRKQMSIFNDSVTQVDKSKQKQDRQSLMAAAQRNVRASMTAQDARVFNETGKVSPAMMAEWEAKAKAKAEAESQVRMANHGMVSIGGGKFLDQSEVDAIAAAKVQPTLNDISETAEKRRARDEELRQQQLERERIAAEKAADDKERASKTKEEWQRFRDEEKQEEKARKEEARLRKTEEKRHRDEEKRRTALGKFKDIFHKDESEDGNREALERLEGKVETTDRPVPTQRGDGYTDIIVPAPSTIHEPPNKDVVSLPVTTITGTTAEETADRVVTAPVVGSGDIDASGSGMPGSSAEEIARRVFAAPVVAGGDSMGEDTLTTQYKEPGEPKISMDDVSPSKGNSLPLVTEQAAPHVGPNLVQNSQAPPLAERSAVPPAVLQPSTETTVTGPSTPISPSKEKDGSKVSTWLKSKLGRRSSKAANTTAPDTKPTISAPKDPKVFVGAANLGAPDTSTKTSSDKADSSMREVAMAGKEVGPVDAPVVSPASELEEDETVQPPTTAIMSGAIPAEEENDTDKSSSISSLSSDEDTRGRSNVRLADQIQQSGPIFGTTAATHDRPAAAVEKDFAGLKSGDSETQEFQEASDKFGEETLLEPPKKGVIGSSVGEGRKSDSPARDSKFVENL